MAAGEGGMRCEGEGVRDGVEYSVVDFNFSVGPFASFGRVR